MLRNAWIAGFSRVALSTGAMLAAVALIISVGCSSEGKHGDGHAAGEVHKHPKRGPHGGDLIELGKEDYHIEMIHDDRAHVATFYILDKTATKTLPIEAAELVANLKLAGTAKQFKIPAKPEADEKGTSSRFESTEKDFVYGLDAEGVEAEIVVTIGETQYRGKIEHAHDEAGHKH